MPEIEETKPDNQEPTNEEQEEEENKSGGYEDRVMSAIMSITEPEPEEGS